ncbi:MAG: transcriptional repressor [Actinomycetota bacterium]|nr:transcriptional repressor [Actinomycetota bacterium]
MTPQRSHIRPVLAESEEHLTAEEVWGRARSGLPGLELSTVYRLEARRAAGLVADSRLPEGPWVFEARSASHPHLVYEGCGEIFPDPGVGRRPFEALNAGSGGFEARELHVVARATCVRCAGQEEGEAVGSSAI